MVSVPIPLVIVPVGVLVLIVHFAVSKKSGLLVRWAAIMALILIGVSVVVCLFVLFAEPGAVVVKGPRITIDPYEEVRVVQESDPMPLLVFAAVLLIFIAVVVYHALREQYKHKKPPKERQSGK